MKCNYELQVFAAGITTSPQPLIFSARTAEGSCIVVHTCCPTRETATKKKTATVRIRHQRVLYLSATNIIVHKACVEISITIQQASVDVPITVLSITIRDGDKMS